MLLFCFCCQETHYPVSFQPELQTFSSLLVLMPTNINVRPDWDSEGVCLCVCMCVCMSCDGLVTRPGCIPAAYPVSAGLLDGWMMVVFSQSNFWQQPVQFDRSLWTFLTRFLGRTCASSVILLVHFSPLSFFEWLSLFFSVGCRQRWEWASEWNHHCVCVKFSWFAVL